MTQLFLAVRDTCIPKMARGLTMYCQWCMCLSDSKAKLCTTWHLIRSCCLVVISQVNSSYAPGRSDCFRHESQCVQTPVPWHDCVCRKHILLVQLTPPRLSVIEALLTSSMAQPAGVKLDVKCQNILLTHHQSAVECWAMSNQYIPGCLTCCRQLSPAAVAVKTTALDACPSRGFTQQCQAHTSSCCLALLNVGGLWVAATQQHFHCRIDGTSCCPRLLNLAGLMQLNGSSHCSMLQVSYILMLPWNA